MLPRLFSSRLTPRHRWIYCCVAGFFVLIFVAMIWPVAVLFSHVRPLVIGLPFYLFYLTVLLLSSFFVLLALYLWEDRSGSSSDPGEEGL